MTDSFRPSVTPLPDSVLDALREGNNIEAIKRLRESTGLGLAEAKGAIDHHLRGNSPAPRNSLQFESLSPAASNSALPSAVTDALRRGNKIEAIKLLRAHTGLGLKEAKDAIDASEPGVMGKKGKLGRGEVARSGNALGWTLVIVVAIAAAYFFLRG